MADEDGLKAQKLLAQGSALGNHGRKFVALLIAIIPRAKPWEGTEKGTQF